MRWALLVALIFVLVTSTGCMIIDTHITVHRDGSAIMVIHLAATDPLFNAHIEEVVEEIFDVDEFADVDVTIKEVDGKQTAAVKILIDNLNDIGNGAFVYSQDNDTYRLELAELSPTEPLTLTITMPGTITDSNGEQVDNRTVRWTDFHTNCWVESTDIAGLSSLVFAAALLLVIAGAGLLWHRFTTTSPKHTPRYCVKCGSKLDANARFCSDCGNEVDQGTRLNTQ